MIHAEKEGDMADCNQQESWGGIVDSVCRLAHSIRIAMECGPLEVSCTSGRVESSPMLQVCGYQVHMDMLCHSDARDCMFGGICGKI